MFYIDYLHGFWLMCIAVSNNLTQCSVAHNASSASEANVSTVQNGFLCNPDAALSIADEMCPLPLPAPPLGVLDIPGADAVRACLEVSSTV